MVTLVISSLFHDTGDITGVKDRIKVRSLFELVFFIGLTNLTMVNFSPQHNAFHWLTVNENRWWLFERRRRNHDALISVILPNASL